MDQLEDKDRSSTVRHFSKGLSLAQEVWADVAEVRRFLSEENLTTLRSWGRHEGAPMAFFIRRDGGTLLVGRTEERSVALAIPTKAFDNQLPKLPAVVTPDVD
jgi:hypothetical protein